MEKSMNIIVGLDDPCRCSCLAAHPIDFVWIFVLHYSYGFFLLSISFHITELLMMEKKVNVSPILGNNQELGITHRLQVSRSSFSHFLELHCQSLEDFILSLTELWKNWVLPVSPDELSPFFI